MPSPYDWSFVGRVVSEGYPTAPLELDYVFTQSVIRVDTEYSITYPGQKNWYMASWMQQVNDLTEKAEIYNFLLPLNQRKFFYHMTQDVSSYCLIFRPRPYLPKLTIYVYVLSG